MGKGVNISMEIVNENNELISKFILENTVSFVYYILKFKLWLKGKKVHLAMHAINYNFSTEYENIKTY